MRTLKVNLDKKTLSSHDIRIGRNILDRMILLVAKNHKAARYVIVTDSNVNPIYGQALLGAMRQAGLPAAVLEIPAGEASKTMSTVLEITGRLLALGADRETLLVALGGGVVGDLTGFIASVYMRGVPYIQIPTTLIGQVDSAVGGKTAVDLPQGKNLLGTFYQPRAVFVDLDYLTTLPPKEYQNGLAEIIKYGMIEDDKLFKFLEENMEEIKNRDAGHLAKIVETCLRIKKSIVEIDEREQGLRRILNFGHTLGHALEAASDYTLSHGEGVALGMIGAARLSAKMHYLPDKDLDRLEKVIAAAGLPTRIGAAPDLPTVIDRLKMDKKKKDDVVHFVLVKKIGLPFINGGISDGMIAGVLEEMKA
ncbi:MAG: 3-dehydroquinate synthase [Deltaproteobacteria bacterium]|nr:3-dehydroquinate synthase [Deltaproteobacteria bacterium]